MERMEGRAKEKDKDGQSVNPRLAWDVCVLVNLGSFLCSTSVYHQQTRCKSSRVSLCPFLIGFNGDIPSFVSRFAPK